MCAHNATTRSMPALTPPTWLCSPSSIGSVFIGVILNVWLYGFSCVQAYIYFSYFKKDKTFMKVFVAFLMVADTLNSILDTVMLYDYVITNFGDKIFMNIANTTFATDPTMTGIIAFSTQCFFAWRVRKLTNSWILPVMIVTLGTASFLSAIGSTIGVQIVKQFAEFQKFKVVVIIWLVCAAMTDILITGSLIWTLNKSRTGFAATDDIIARLIRGTLQTGLLTSVFAVVDIILFLAFPNSLHLIPNLPLAKLYVNSLLSTLNARVMMGNRSHYTMEGTDSDASRLRNRRVSNFRPGGSRGEGGNRLASFRPTASQNGKDPISIENGIHVTTVEERFEEPPNRAAFGAPALPEHGYAASQEARSDKGDRSDADDSATF